MTAKSFGFQARVCSCQMNYSKMIAYGATVTTVTSIPISDAELSPPYLLLAGPGYGYANDGIVPLKSALFDGTSVQTREVDGSCDHFQIYSGQNTVSGGTYIFDSIASDLQTIVPYAPLGPVIASVSPSTMPISSSPQAIRIIGSGFTSSSTLLFNGSTISDSARLTLVSANEIDYNVIVESTGSWSVQVVNGSQTSNLKYFTVNAPPTSPTGSLVVNLSPAGAVSAARNGRWMELAIIIAGKWSATSRPVHTRFHSNRFRVTRHRPIKS